MVTHDISEIRERHAMEMARKNTTTNRPNNLKSALNFRKSP